MNLREYIKENNAAIKHYTNLKDFKNDIENLDVWCDSDYDDNILYYLSFSKPVELIGEYDQVNDTGVINFNLVK